MKFQLLIALIATLGLQAGPIKHRVAYDNCGVDQQSKHVTIKSGNYAFTNKEISFKDIPKNSPLRTVIYGDRKVGLTYGGLKPSASYKIKLSFLSDDNNRIQRVWIGDKILIKKITLPKGKLIKKEISIPKELYKQGKLQVTIETMEGLNSVLSEAELISDTQGLNEQMEMELTLLPGPEVEGKVIDLNSGKPLSGVSVVLAGITVTTDQDGKFSSKIKKQTSDLIVTAAKGKLNTTITLSAKSFDVFNLPRLSPRPDHTEIISLNGTWNFQESVPKNFPQNKRALSKKIEVPGEWVMQGYTVKKNTPAAFHRRFHVPISMKNKRVKLRFDGVYSDCTVYVNGHKAGGHIGGFTPFELDITDFIKIGTPNDLSLTVQNESVADTMASATKYACHELGGISRKVSLFALPMINFSSLAIRTDLDENYRDAKLNIELEITNEDQSSSHPKLSYELTDPSGKKTQLNANLQIPTPIQKGEALIVTQSFSISNPKKWDCENPNLYTLTIQLSTGHTIIKKFGFKETEVRGTQLFVNGKPVKLRGSNRHEVHPLRGRSLTGNLWRQDVKLFRNANVNLIRTCHYPPGEELLDAADELGIFVEVEGPFCWEWKSSEPSHLKLTVQQNMEMVLRDRNHPSVLCWSIANESGWGPNFAAASKAMRMLDPTRPQIFNTWFQKIQTYTEPYCEIANIHYPGYNAVKIASNYNKRPVYLGEYIHLNAYNRLELASDRGLRDKWGEYFLKIWEQIYAEPTLLGGSIWSGIDDTFYLKNDVTVGYGTWGPIDGWRRPKPEWYHTKKVYSPIRILNKELHVHNNQITILIENRQDFSNLSRLRIDWKLGKENGSLRADIASKSKGNLTIPITKPQQPGSHLELRFLDPRGFEVDSFRLPVDHEKVITKKISNDFKFTIKKTADSIIAQSSDTIYIIDKKSGQLTSLIYNSKPMKISGPHLMILPLNSTGTTQMKGKTLTPKPFTDTCKNWKPNTVNVKGNTVVVTGSYEEANGSFTYHFNTDGSCTIDYDFTCNKKINPRQVGLVFDVPSEFSNLSWKRKGFWTTYPEWHIGRLVGKINASDGIETTSVGPKIKPNHEWRLDRGPAGSHDFASTKHNIYSASLTDESGHGLEVTANADRHTRAWINKKSLRLLVAHYSNGGSERFLRRLSSIDDRPLNKGAPIKSSTTIRPSQ